MHGPFAGIPVKPWKVRKQLEGLDPKLDEALAEVKGEPELNWVSDPFAALINAMSHQAIGFKGGADRYDALVEACGGRITPAAIAKLRGQERVFGYSEPLRKAMLAVADAVLGDELDLDVKKLKAMNPQQLEKHLSRPYVKDWTILFFRLYYLHDQSVLLLGDVSLLNAIEDWYDLPGRPTPEQLRKLAEKWHPHEAAACWFIFKAWEKRKAQQKETNAKKSKGKKAASKPGKDTKA